ncbi:MAG: hypothetical protein ACK5PB_06050 [Pirellula sp.]
MLFFAQSEVLSSRYFLGNPAWAPWLMIAGIILSILSILSYRGSRMTIGMRLASLAMRLFGIGLLLLCLLEPMGVQERAKSQANAFAVVVDNSQSVQEIWDARNNVASAGLSEKWYRNLFRDDSSWIRRLGEEFRLRRYVFSSGLDPIDSFEGIAMNGVDSSLVGSLLSLRDRYISSSKGGDRIASTVPLAGVLLFTDGQATDRSEWTSLKEMGIPIYPVVCGDIGSQKDIAISSISVNQTDFETAPVTLTATVSSTGYESSTIEVDLIDGDGNLIQTKPAESGEEKKSAKVEFRFRPSAPGVQGYKLLARSINDSKLSSLPNDAPNSSDTSKSVEEEITTLNNQRYQIVDRGRGPFRVLYLAGRPNWEYKFLSRAISEDAEVELTALIRIAKKEPKFNFRDNRVDSANPLFSGFEDVSEEEKEQFDQPVFVRLGLTEAGQLQAGFPKDDEELFSYNAILIDDLESDFLSMEQQSMIRRFVTVRGGGLLMLGGQESMRGKSFENSVLSQLLPVYGDSISEDPSDWTNNPNEAVGQQIRFELTREGWLQPFMRTVDTELREKERLSEMPDFQVVNKTSDVKPGASVLASGTLAGPGSTNNLGELGESGDRNSETVPLFVVQKYGRGRTAAFLIGDWWRWAMHRKSLDQSPMFQAWRQMIRWMVNDVPRSITMSSEKVTGAAKLRRIIADVKGPDFKIVDNAIVNVELKEPDGNKTELRLEPSLDVPGRYESIVLCEQDGIYVATATCESEDESILGNAQTGWANEPIADELRQLGEDSEFLRQIAAASGGKVVSLNELESFTANVPSDLVPIRERITYPLWHQSWVIVVALACLCAEWSLRRRYGLA